MIFGRTIICSIVFFFIGNIIQAQSLSVSKILTDSITYDVSFQSTISDGYSPLWLNANRYGLSSVEGKNGYLRAGLFKNTCNRETRWNVGYGLDLALPYHFTSKFVVQQLYVDVDYRKVRLSLGSKERTMMMKNNWLSSGSQTFGINARPIPEVRIELPDYISISGKKNWLAIKGHFGYGMMTDGIWQERYVDDGYHYAKRALYHSKAGYLRLGNEELFPLVFEGGLEMACQFGGTIYNPLGREGTFQNKIEMGTGFKDFINAIFGGGNDVTDDVYANAAGNTVGSWLFALSYKLDKWKIRAYYDHFFEDHSMMFFEYGWKDGLWGLELTLPSNRWVDAVVYEFMNTTYQSGPVYHDSNETIGDQISGKDDYYNHNLYQGWQHWGQAIGNPLFHSPLYQNDGTLYFSGNRFKAHHIGLSGRPMSTLGYRILYSYMTNWGTYAVPAVDRRFCSSFLGEICYSPERWGKLNMRGWNLSAAFALDRGKEIGNNTGFQMTLRKTGLLLK